MLMGMNNSGGLLSSNIHFTSPYMVLPADHRLEAENLSGDPDYTNVFEVYVSGLLVTNVSYLPLVNR